MKLGSYGNGNTKFDKLVVRRFPVTLWDSYLYGKTGCGATALGLITGINPSEIATARGKNHYSDRFMVDFLRKCGISVYQVNKANLTNQKKWNYKLKDNNVILYSSLIQKKEATWFVSAFSNVYHNCEITKASYLDFLNFPIDSFFVLYRKEWA